MDQNRHKVKRQRSNKRPKSPPKGTNKICTTDIPHMDQRLQFSAKLQSHVGGDRKEPTEDAC